MEKVVLVTGAGRGIGAATAKKLASQGYKVVVNYLRDSASAHQVVDAIIKNGGEAIALQADVSEESEVERLFVNLKAHFGEISHLVNNAGILASQMSLQDMSLARFINTLQVNVASCFLCCRAFIQHCEKDGAIVNVSSVAARTGAPFEYIDYAASKGAIDSLTKGLSLELAEKNIRVNAVRPAFIETTMHADGGEPDRVKRMLPQIPLGRGGTTMDVANTIAWLLSDEASYITGTYVDVSGGK